MPTDLPRDNSLNPCFSLLCVTLKCFFIWWILNSRDSQQEEDGEMGRDSQGPSFIIAVISSELVMGSKPTSVPVKANFHFLLLFFPEEKLFEELEWRNWFLAYGWWVLTNDQRVLRTLGFDFGKHAQFRCLFKAFRSHQSLRRLWQLQKKWTNCWWLRSSQGVQRLMN